MELTAITSFLLNYSLSQLWSAMVLEKPHLRLAMLGNIAEIARVYEGYAKFDAVEARTNEVEPALQSMYPRNLQRDYNSSPPDRPLFQRMLSRLDSERIKLREFNYAEGTGGTVIFTG